MSYHHLGAGHEEAGVDDREALVEQLAEENAELRAEIKRLRKMQIPQWFYHDGYSSEDCYDSPAEVLEYLDLKPGDHVIAVNCAGPMPSIWCAVRVLTPEQMDAQETDDHVIFTEHGTEAEARSALAAARGEG